MQVCSFNKIRELDNVKWKVRLGSVKLCSQEKACMYLEKKRTVENVSG